VFVYIQNGLEAVEKGHFQHADGTTGTAAVGTNQATIHAQMEDNGWALYKEGEYGDIYVFAAKITDPDKTIVKDTENKAVAQIIPKTSGMVKLDVVSTFTVDEHAELSAYATAEINITAYAVQANTFDSVDAAWAAIVQAYPKQAPVMDPAG
jgi:hypothetical protein